MKKRSWNRAFLLLGGNVGDREKQLQSAKELLAHRCGSIIASSSLYQTAAWGRQNQPPFLNQALLLQTPLTADELLKEIVKIETSLGRLRQEKYGPRTIDIDILFYNNEVISKPHLNIPHPELPHRRFALVPLAEIAADYLHPQLKKTVAELLEQCPDPLAVEKLSGAH